MKNVRFQPKTDRISEKAKDRTMVAIDH